MLQSAIHQLFGRIFPKLAVLPAGGRYFDASDPGRAHKNRTHSPCGPAFAPISGVGGGIRVFVLVSFFSGLSSGLCL